jgi:hypothetical protein
MKRRPMHVSLATIDVDTSSAEPVFHVKSAASIARILMFGVTRADSGGAAWEIATVEWARRPTYTATTQIVLESEHTVASLERGPEAEGELWEHLASAEQNRQVSSVTYGDVPKGFQQTYPEHGPPVPLRQGTRYRVAIIGACLGEAVFTA